MRAYVRVCVCALRRTTNGICAMLPVLTRQAAGVQSSCELYLYHVMFVRLLAACIDFVVLQASSSVIRPRPWRTAMCISTAAACQRRRVDDNIIRCDGTSAHLNRFNIIITPVDSDDNDRQAQSVRHDVYERTSRQIHRTYATAAGCDLCWSISLITLYLSSFVRTSLNDNFMNYSI